MLGDDGYQALIASTTKLNTVGAELAAMDGVHALTDVTGFGLLGHALEVCRARAWPRTSICSRCR